MDFNIVQAALDSLPANTPFRIANEARVPATYRLAQYLPEIPQFDYDVNAANMVIKATMAEHVGMDSPYREGGVIVGSTFKESTAKIANVVRLPEAAQRKMQQLVTHRLARREQPISAIAETFLNFTNKLIVQPHLDTAEFMRGRAIFTGKIDWTCDGRRLLVDYGFKASHKLADLTGNNGFGGTTSQFWPTIVAARRLLNQNVRAFLMHNETIELAIANPVNKIEVVGIEQLDRYTTRYRLTQLVGATDRPNPDKRYSVELLGYNMEAEVVNESAPKTTRIIRMVQPGEFAALGGGAGNTMLVGEGSTPEPEMDTPASDDAIGYTHLAPTVEGDGVPGRFADAYRPQRERWTFEGIGVSNLLPVIPEDNRVVIRKTNMA